MYTIVTLKYVFVKKIEYMGQFFQKSFRGNQNISDSFHPKQENNFS